MQMYSTAVKIFGKPDRFVHKLTSVIVKQLQMFHKVISFTVSKNVRLPNTYGLMN